MTTLPQSSPRFADEHSLLEFHREHVVFDEPLTLAMREAATFGAMFAERIGMFEGAPKSDFTTALKAELNRRAASTMSNGTKLLLNIAFLCRAVETLRDPHTECIEGYRPHTMAIMTQHCITQAKLVLPTSTMQTLWKGNLVVGVGEAIWRKTLTGAFRVTNVANLLGHDEFGWPRQVYLPTVDEDRDSIDLLVTNGKEHGFAMQVKSYDGDGIRLLKILEEPTGGNLRRIEILRNRDTGPDELHRGEAYGISRKLWLRTAELNVRYNIRFNPVVAYVGKR